MIPLPAPKAILFDWDNTLVDTWPLIHQSLNMLMAHMGHAPWSIEKVRDNVKQSMRDAFPEMFGDRWPEAAEFYQNAYRSMHLQALTPLARAEEALQMIQARGIFCAVVSNKRGPSLRAESTHLGWDHYFTKLVGADDAPRDKPHADPALMALDASGYAQDGAVWFVGDTGVDLACAKAIGATAILYGDHVTQNQMHDGEFFHAHARDHTAFMALIGANA